MTLTPNSMAPAVDAPQELAPSQNNMSNDQQVTKKRRFTSAIITVTVGDDEATDDFQVHEDLLRKHSEFFQAALDRKWKEGQERKITLPEDDADVVAVYIQWLYGVTIKDGATGTLVDSGRIRSTSWAKLYIFGDKIQDPEFANAAIEAWMVYIDHPPAGEGRSYPSAACARTIYQHTTSGSLLRQFVVHIWATRCTTHLLEENCSERILLQCPEFLLDLARANASKAAGLYQGLYEQREKWLHKI